jgi:nucleoside-triphosphatase THEP1
MSAKEINMSRLDAAAPITALIYGEGREIDPVMTRLAHHLADTGMRLAGFIQHNAPRTGRRRCDMILEELASGESFGISQDRGPEARGCHLDVGELLRGIALGRAGLATAPDLLIINKFGKIEGEGGGFRPLMAEALDQGIPMLVAVPWRNIDSWRLFAGDMAREVAVTDLDGDPAAILAAIGFSAAAPAGTTRRRSHRRTARPRSSCPD